MLSTWYQVYPAHAFKMTTSYSPSRFFIPCRTFPYLPFPSAPKNNNKAIGKEADLQGSVTSVAQMLLPPPAASGKRTGGSAESGGVAAGVAHERQGDDDDLSPPQEDFVSQRGERMAGMAGGGA